MEKAYSWAQLENSALDDDGKIITRWSFSMHGLIARIATLFCITAVLAGILPGCERNSPVSYHGIDITGATYAADFRLSDPDGRERTLADFSGKAVLIFFGFTHCPDICPTALARAAEVKRLLGTDGERFQALFVTIDPERDTPEVLKAYTAAFDPGFIGLYGSASRTAQTARDFRAYYKKVPTGSSYTMDHSSLSYIYDPQGRLRLALGHEKTAQEFAEDIRKILAPRFPMN